MLPSMLTKAQSQALEKVREIMVEHFDNHVLVAEVDFEVPDENGKPMDVGNALVSYKGSRAAAVGLCDMGKMKLLMPDDHEDEV